VEAAQHGDRAALDQLLRRHYERVHAICRRIAGGRRDADDACQEAMIKIVRSLPRFDGRSSFGTWAYRVATNAALDELRRRRRRPALRAVGDDDGSEEPADGLAERRVTSVEDRLALDAALDELPEDFRVAVVLRDVADLDYDEIAAALDVPIGTVKSRIARGRRALADRLRIEDLPAVSADDEPPDDTGNRTPGSRRPTRVDPLAPTSDTDPHHVADEPT
jgi:RNA polymerase sigma-70 factor (ECF subfamily)